MNRKKLPTHCYGFAGACAMLVMLAPQMASADYHDTAHRYEPTGSAPYYWSTLENWAVGTSAASALPTTADDVIVTSPSTNPDTPLIIPSECSAAAKTFYFGVNPTAITCVSNLGSLVVSGNAYLGHLGQGTNLVENFGTMTVKGQLYIARSSNSHKNPCVTRMNVHEGSRLILADNVQQIVAVGGDGIGELHVRGEVLVDDHKTFYLGYYDCSAANCDHSTGLIEVSGNGSIVTNATKGLNVTLLVGYKPRSVGTVRLLDNAVFRISPNWPAGNTPTFGLAEDTTAYLVMSNNAVFAVTKNQNIDFAAGTSSTAFVTLADDAYAFSAVKFNFGAGKGAHVEATLSGSSVMEAGTDVNMAPGESASARISIQDNAQLQSRWSAILAAGKGSRADVEMKGGKLAIRPIVPYSFLNVGSDDSQARIFGYGKIGTHVYQTSKKNWYLQLEMNGQIIADGMGASRTLDMGLFMNVNNATYAKEGHGNLCGTNGWYAVNGGRLILPQYLEVTNASWCVGDYPLATAPSFPGAFKVDFASTPTESYLHASLYSAEHADVPAGLPAESRFVCVEDVWHLGYGAGQTQNNGWDTSEPTSAVDFGSANITFRFGARSLKSGRRGYRVKAWKYDFANTKWIVVSEKEYDPTNPTVVFSNVTPSSDGVSNWNMGWYAVTLERPSGMMLMVR